VAQPIHAKDVTAKTSDRRSPQDNVPLPGTPQQFHSLFGDDMLSRPPFTLGTFPRLPRSKFHTSALLATATAREPSHYETLSISESATRADIKKLVHPTSTHELPQTHKALLSRRFYELSKTHHPDRNRGDPHASKKFVKISNAYSILGNPKSREKYDRELQRLRPSGPRSSHSNPVGGRPATGLSRRRTQPHGPPPSFFRNGGWTYRERHDTGKAKSSGFNSAGGMGVGGQGGADRHDVPHFNWDGKYKQHELHEQRRRGRNQSNGTSHDRPMIIQVVVVSSILVFTVWSAAFGAKRKEENDKKKKQH